MNLKKKETKPKWLGRKPRNSREWKELIRYCRLEIKAEYNLAQYILGIHKKYNVGYTVSIAQLGSKIFRKCFLKSRIPQAPYLVRLFLSSCTTGYVTMDKKFESRLW